MALPPYPSAPTRRLPPAGAPVRHREVVSVDSDEVLWRDEVRGRLRSLAAALTVAVAVAFVALGVALWALLGDDDTGRGAGDNRVRALEQRVDQLESATGRGATREEVRALRDQQQV